MTPDSDNLSSACFIHKPVIATSSNIELKLLQFEAVDGEYLTIVILEFLQCNMKLWCVQRNITSVYFLFSEN